jgi:hypothetical protein
MEKRVIHINPDLFLNTTTTKKNRGKVKIKIKGQSKQPKKVATLKKGHLLKMIRERQENMFNKKYGEMGEAKIGEAKMGEAKIEEPVIQEFNKDFKEAQNYFETLLKKEEEEKKVERELEKQNNFIHNRTIRQHHTAPPQYGCLKNGSLPTYRNYMKKTRSNQCFPLQIQEEIPMKGQGQGQTPHLEGIPLGISIPTPIPSYNSSTNFVSSMMTPPPTLTPTPPTPIIEMKPQPLQQHSITETMSIMDSSNKNENRSMMESIKQFSKHPFQNNIREKPKKPTKQKKTIRRTYRVGKSKVFSRVSVLISNKTIRNNVTTKTQMMKTLPIQEIKRYLVKHGLIKIGSNTPNDILRKMYESASLMCGEVFNHNPDNLLHNFINGSEEE